MQRPLFSFSALRISRISRIPRIPRIPRVPLITKRLLFATAGIAVALSVMLPGSGVGTPSGEVTHSQSTLRQIIERVRAEVVPADDAGTGYGPHFNTGGYQTLLSWHSQYRVPRAQADVFESLDLTLPCCAFGHPTADEAKNCGCGHHQALSGLSKRLLGLGYDQKAVQVEVGRWAGYFFPRETMEAALSQRAGSDPAVQEALDELRQKGGC